VFGIDHNDGSNGYTEKSDGTPVIYDKTQDFTSPSGYTSKARIRDLEISALIDEI
jgi:hypothetical protein